MSFKTKTFPLVILGILSVVFSRIMFSFINDPEGPNLLVVFGAALMVYVPTLLIYVCSSAGSNLKKFLLTVVIQILLFVVLYWSALFLF